MMTAGKWKLVLVVAGGLAVLTILGFMGVATWYAGRINAEYKEVADSEEALRAATEGPGGYVPPAGAIPPADRIEVFLAVREELTAWRRTMASASTKFAADQEAQRRGGLKDLLKLFNTGSDLAPVYAGFWTARNRTLLDHGMGPGEFEYIFRLVYWTWLDMDREPVSKEKYPVGDLDAVLEPYRERLVASFDEDVALVELIFQDDKPR